MTAGEGLGQRELDGAALLARIEAMAEVVAAWMADPAAAGLVPPQRWALVAIRRGGIALAARLGRALAARGHAVEARGEVDITLYRDDLYTGREHPVMGITRLPFPVDGAGILLVDDVLFTGRTVRAALGEIHDYGRPAFVRLVAAVDRGHRELPIAPDLAGVALRTALPDRVTVVLEAEGEGPEDGVWVRRGAG